MQQFLEQMNLLGTVPNCVFIAVGFFKCALLPPSAYC